MPPKCRKQQVQDVRAFGKIVSIRRQRAMFLERWMDRWTGKDVFQSDTSIQNSPPVKDSSFKTHLPGIRGRADEYHTLLSYQTDRGAWLTI
eukprot:scaffold15695_cov160-Amphora_coffeaeformis.AAC.5